MSKLFILLFALLLSACALTPQSTESVAIYDLGLHQINAQQNNITAHSKTPSILLTDIASPVWLDNHAIHYRLVYQNAAQRYTYANSRWAAAPAALLTQQIGEQIQSNTDFKVVSAVHGALADYALHLTLEDFSQIFDATNQSHVIVHLHINLIERRTRTLRAQRQFKIQKIAATANAAGAVYALIEASNQLNKEIMDWLSNELTSKN